MTDTAEIAKALAAFQAEMPTVAKTHTAKVQTKSGPGYSYTYADLADVTAAAIPLLVKNGLAFSACPQPTERGYELVGVLLHSSGQSLRGSLPVAGNTPQELGSSLTYARRYLFGCMTGVVTDDDDDGALASKPRARKPAASNNEPWPEAVAGKTVSEAQVALMGTLMSKLGMTDRALALEYVKSVIGREVASRNDLTVNEASAVIERLKQDEKAGAPA